MADRSCSYSSI